MKRAISYLCAAMLALAGNNASAEPVLIRTGTDGIGQGWMFKYGSECLVATAGHVLVNGRGTVISATGDFGDISSVQNHPTLDLAIASVEGLLKANCPVETLGYRDSRPILDDASRSNRALTMQYVPLCEKQSQNCGVTNVLVRIEGFSPRDALFSFFPQGGLIDDNEGGDSGSIIRDTAGDGVATGQPLGLVIEKATADDGAALPSIAIVFSEVRKMLEDRKPKSSAENKRRKAETQGRRNIRLVDFRGALADPSCGPLNALSQSGCSFAARPAAAQPTVEIVVEKTDEQPVTGFTVRFAEGKSLPKGFEIGAINTAYAGFANTRWTSLRYCRPDSYEYSCTFIDNSAKNYILRFAGDIYISSIEMK